jgi:hypothetical protein
MTGYKCCRCQDKKQYEFPKSHNSAKVRKVPEPSIFDRQNILETDYPEGTSFGLISPDDYKCNRQESNSIRHNACIQQSSGDCGQGFLSVFMFMKPVWLIG